MATYGMFSAAGANRVQQLINTMKVNQVDVNTAEGFQVMMDLLADLAKIKRFSEATDTVVREAVYVAMGGRVRYQ